MSFNYYFFDSTTGQIGYALVPMIARGMMLGPNQPVILHMLDIEPAAEALKGVKMELTDAAFPLLRGMFFQSMLTLVQLFTYWFSLYNIYLFVHIKMQ